MRGAAVRESPPYEGIEINHPDETLSSIVEHGGVTIDIGEDWAGRHHGPHRPQGFQRYTCITLTPDEAMRLCRWLVGAIDHLKEIP
jgi:hypothetical protein